MANWPIVKSPATGENVRTVQYLLNAQGASLSVDGIFGPLTTAATQQFQSGHGLAADGIVGNQTWPALVIQVASGANGPAVQAVQSQANSRIANLLVVDGAFGPKTDAVVRAFQGAIGLVADGIVGPLTWNALVNGFLTATSGADAAQRVFTAWTQADQATAGRHATPAAVTQLFTRSFSPADGWTFAGSSGGAGSIFSRWTRPGGELVLRANNNVGTPFFYVTSATFNP